MTTLLEEYQQARDQGRTPDELLFLMHQGGLTIIQAIKTFREVYKVPLIEAKEKVAASPFWRDIVQASEPLHDQLEESFRQEPQNGSATPSGG
jgi:ribosomal protein L7/L12